MNKNQIIILAVIGLAVIGLIFAFLFGRKDSGIPDVQGEVLIWGVFDDSDVMRGLISRFQASYPKVKITYQKKTIDTYEKDLVNALATGSGPDIFYIHNTWLPKHIDKLTPTYQDYMTVSSFKDIFVDVAYEDFVADGEIYAVPLYADTLALFYNKDILNGVGIANPPATWEGLLSMVPSLTQKDESGNIVKSAISIGTAKNVNRATDILSLLMLQSGTKLFDKDNMQATFNRGATIGSVSYPSGEKALEFYTNFANPRKTVYTWNGLVSYSIDAFLEGKVAMMLNYYYQVENLRQKSPHLKFGVSLMPQFKNSTQIVNYANYWGATVSKTSKNPEISWLFVHFLTDKDQAREYLEKTNKPTARRDLVDAQRQESKELGIFAQQSLSAYSWYQPDSDKIEKIFEKMIESTVDGAPIRSTLDSAAQATNSLIER